MKYSKMQNKNQHVNISKGHRDTKLFFSSLMFNPDWRIACVGALRVPDTNLYFQW